MSGARLHANLGAEEGDDAPSADAAAAVAPAARLWSLLFGRGARAESRGALDGFARDDVWPDALGPAPEAAAYPFLDGVAESAWLEASPAAREVHDKAFAWRTARDEGLVPRCLRDVVRVLEPDELRDAARARRMVEETVSAWPAWTRAAEGRFTLKPRFGCSGRGRLAGWAPGAERAPADAAFARLAGRGGALLEPWLEREEDLAAALWIDATGMLHLLGTLELRVSDAGVYRGHRGTLDSRRRAGSGSEHDAALRDAAAALGVAAAAAGYRGPAGLDAFVFRGPDGESVLRPVVEWNARFTMGTLVLGLLRRALDAGVLKRPRPGVLGAFAFALGGALDAADAGGAPGVARLALDVGLPGPPPVLLYARDAAALGAAGVSSRSRPSASR